MKNKLQNFLEKLFQTISDALSIGEQKVIHWMLNHFKGKELLEIGTKLTYYYFAFFLLFFGWKIPNLFFSPLSNIGDFLAGVFGPIAFGWLIIGYLMQNKELKNSVEQTSEAQRLARDQLDFQIKVKNYDLIKEHNEAQPIFIIKFNILNKSNIPKTAIATIKNIGREVIFFEAMLSKKPFPESDIKGIQILGSKSNFKNNEEVEVKINIDDELKRTMNREYSFDIFFIRLSFIDGLKRSFFIDLPSNSQKYENSIIIHTSNQNTIKPLPREI
ncbi:hypothetical protein [Marinomonas foliarum]|uniref:Uncharacterized protein n=1 Tax=Marinomonas foliarum TaxID=491950 RepID=A0ABX7INF8_9GAMM|nr:hypothetical protein [Marinomonas foliarum]QRV22784.1 hypothetical protein JSY38_11970 [Marinomonas foliarum]